MRELVTVLMKAMVLFTVAFYQNPSTAQELGYITGVTKQGIDPARFEPLYGFSIGTRVNKFFAVETAMFYSQRSIGNLIQADYFSFTAIPEIGFFGKKIGVYYGSGISLNPTLHHSNIENHTYLSTLQTVGGQFNIIPEIRLDLKAGMDIGLTGAYFENGTYQKYSGPIVILSLKYVLK